MRQALYTIGFAGKTAQTFFELLQKHQIGTVVDIRLNNRSQLAGFAKAGDLEYFLSAIAGIGYVHYPLLAPSAELLKDYRGGKITWAEYEPVYRKILNSRKLRARLKQDFPLWKAPLCLLCSEPTAEHCHRRLAAEFLAKLFKIKQVEHL